MSIKPKKPTRLPPPPPLPPKIINSEFGDADSECGASSRSFYSSRSLQPQSKPDIAVNHGSCRSESSYQVGSSICRNCVINSLSAASFCQLVHYVTPPNVNCRHRRCHIQEYTDHSHSCSPVHQHSVTPSIAQPTRLMVEQQNKPLPPVPPVPPPVIQVPVPPVCQDKTITRVTSQAGLQTPLPSSNIPPPLPRTRSYTLKCAACINTITPIDSTGETVHVVSQGKDYHIQCFCCASCRSTLVDKNPSLVDNQLLCQACYVRR